MNGHALDCPVYIKWAKEVYGEKTMEEAQKDYLTPASSDQRRIAQPHFDRASYDALRSALHQLRQSKPDERSEKARRYAVTITEMEGVLARFHMYVVNDGAGE
jgi:hypothetical protein